MGKLVYGRARLADGHPKFGTLVAELEKPSFPYPFAIAETHRSDATAAKYYSWGRTVVNPNTGPLPGKPLGAVVTNAKDSSKTPHGTKPSLGIDILITDAAGNALPDEHPGWSAYGAVVRAVGLVWGGDWKSLKDRPHAELPDWEQIKALLEQHALPIGVVLAAVVVAGILVYLVVDGKVLK